MAILTPVPLPGASGAISEVSVPGGVFGGFVVHATGSASIVKFYDNASAAAGTLLGLADLTAAGTVGSWALVELKHPLSVVNGVWFDLVSGAVEGSVYIA